MNQSVTVQSSAEETRQKPPRRVNSERLRCRLADRVLYESVCLLH